jgi:acetolactate synthase-1/2/3 large subunit
MKVSDYIIKYLHEQKVSHIFEVIGGMTTHLTDSACKHEGMNLISCHHEQAAAFAADSIARVTGIPGIAMATSGPGATNLLTGIAACYFDSSPAIFITGQVNLNEQKKDRPIRQLGFQEADIVSMAQTVVKAAWRISSAEEVPMVLKQAFFVALSGRPGPVLIDIPMDIQRANINNDDFTAQPLLPGSVDETLVEELLYDLSQARQPLILAGGGINSARARDLFRIFVEAINVPVVNSLLAVDVLPYNHPLRVGMIGTYGNRWANLAIGESDLLLVLGSRLDIRQTGDDTNAFIGHRKIYHVDCEQGEMNNRVKGCKEILAHLQPFLTSAMEKVPEQESTDYSQWVLKIKQLKKKWADTAELSNCIGINPNKFMHQLSDNSNLSSAFIVDVGQNQMWAAQSLDLNADQRFLTSGGMAPIGYALPAAIGACIAHDKKPVTMISGDGGFQLNIQELQTIASNNLPVKMVILNNKCYGMVRQFQESYFECRYQSTFWGYAAPDFTQIAKAYGIQSLTVQNDAEIEFALKKMWGDPRAPFLINVLLDMNTNVYPKIAFGFPLTEMEPFAKPASFEKK